MIAAILIFVAQGIWVDPSGVFREVQCPTTASEFVLLPKGCEAQSPGVLLSTGLYISIMAELGREKARAEKLEKDAHNLISAARDALSTPDDPWADRLLWGGIGFAVASLLTVAICYDGDCAWPALLSW